jgi:hypothetical protein
MMYVAGVFARAGGPLTFLEDAMGYFDAAQTRTFKTETKNKLSEDDFAWIRSLINVTVVTSQKKSIRVFTETEDAMVGITNSINKKYCNSSKPKLTPLFSSPL